ncbi:MAG: hypothetical protein U0694_26480 [Anaerolineae bacterium]
MSIEGLIVSLVILGGGLFWLALPFLRRGAWSKAELAQQKERERILANYERIIATIRDLDEDFQLGKFSQEVHTTQRAYWTEQGAETLKLLEQMGGQKKQEPKPMSKQPQADPDAALDAAIEQAIANYVSAKKSGATD